jgi:hypothetical protein
MIPPSLVHGFRRLLFPTVQLFFARPSFQKSDHTGGVCPIEFLLAHLDAVAVPERLTQTLGFVTANHAGFGRMPQAVVTQGKNGVQFAEAIRVFFFFVF